MKLPWSKPTSGDTIEAFWSWFAKRAPSLDLQNPAHQRELGAQLKRINRDLVWGASLGKDGGASRLEISAGGLATLIPTVQAVVERAPEVDGWTIVAFRQPSPSFSISVGSKEINSTTVFWVEQGQTDGRMGIVLYVPLGEANARQEVGFIALDHSIGEYLVMTRIGAIDFEDYVLAPPHARPLGDLTEHLTQSA